MFLWIYRYIEGKEFKENDLMEMEYSLKLNRCKEKNKFHLHLIWFEMKSKLGEQLL